MDVQIVIMAFVNAGYHPGVGGELQPFQAGTEAAAASGSSALRDSGLRWGVQVGPVLSGVAHRLRGHPVDGHGAPERPATDEPRLWAGWRRQWQRILQ